MAHLSAREEEVVRLVADGCSDQAIATALVISRRTVEAHIRRARERFGFCYDPDINPRVQLVTAFLAAEGEKHGPQEAPGI